MNSMPNKLALGFTLNLCSLSCDQFQSLVYLPYLHMVALYVNVTAVQYYFIKSHKNTGEKQSFNMLQFLCDSDIPNSLLSEKRCLENIIPHISDKSSD